MVIPEHKSFNTSFPKNLKNHWKGTELQNEILIDESLKHKQPDFFGPRKLGCAKA